MTATDELRRMLDERGVEYVVDKQGWVFFEVNGFGWVYIPSETHGKLMHQKLLITPEQAIAATLGAPERTCKPDPAFEQWVASLRHDSIDSVGDAVEQLMYEVFEFGGDMGPNGNTYNGIDEGKVMTNDFIDSWVERFVELSARAVEE